MLDNNSSTITPSALKPKKADDIIRKVEAEHKKLQLGKKKSADKRD